MLLWWTIRALPPSLGFLRFEGITTIKIFSGLKRFSTLRVQNPFGVASYSNNFYFIFISQQCQWLAIVFGVFQRRAELFCKKPRLLV